MRPAIKPLIFEGGIHPRKPTWNLKMSPWKRRFLLKTIIFVFHVSFRGCKLWGGGRLAGHKKTHQRFLVCKKMEEHQKISTKKVNVSWTHFWRMKIGGILFLFQTTMVQRKMGPFGGLFTHLPGHHFPGVPTIMGSKFLKFFTPEN